MHRNLKLLLILFALNLFVPFQPELYGQATHWLLGDNPDYWINNHPSEDNRLPPVTSLRDIYHQEYDAFIGQLKAGETGLQSVPDADSLALVDLYNSTDGPNWLRNDNWLEGPVQSWYGITVQQSRVRVITLFANQLAGTFPETLSDLDALREIWVHFNELSGPIPEGWGAMEQLEVLYINDNQLSGPVPAEWGLFRRMREFYSNNNQFTGSIPPELGDMEDTQLFNLSGNQLTGVIPPEIGKFAKLRRICLHDNHLTGSVPNTFGDLEQVRQMLLYNNELSGPLPAGLGNLRNLVQLAAHQNRFTGPLPETLGDVSSLQALNLHTNEISGAIPPLLGNLGLLRTLSLGGNQLIGTIPPELGNLTSLQLMVLAGNRLTGSIPVTFEQLVNLRVLDLSENELTGPVPASVSGIRELRQLLVNGNRLDGNFPVLQNGEITHLHLHSNQIAHLPSFVHLAKLTELRIQENNLRTDDILRNFNHAALFTYNPQHPFGEERADTLVPGAEFIFDTLSDADGNQFRWFFNNQLMDDETGYRLIIEEVGQANEGDYRVEVTHPSLPDFIARSQTISLRTIESVDLEPPVLSEPGFSDLMVLPFDLTWLRHNQDRTYRIQIATDPDFLDLVIDSTLQANNLQLDNESLGSEASEFWWRVRSGAYGAWSEWSETGMFLLNRGIVSVGENLHRPDGIQLMQNYPNPFNPVTGIQVILHDPVNLTMSVHTIQGQLVAVLAEGTFPAGTHLFRFDGRGLASGIYLYRLESGSRTLTRKMLLLR
jgi:Leucine-rich repeat (LRR) protein